MPKHLRSAVSLFLSLSLITLSPGLGAWARAANIVTPAAGVQAGIGGLGAAGAVAPVRMQAPSLATLAAPGSTGLVLPTLVRPTFAAPAAPAAAAATAREAAVTVRLDMALPGAAPAAAAAAAEAPLAVRQTAPVAQAVRATQQARAPPAAAPSAFGGLKRAVTNLPALGSLFDGGRFRGEAGLAPVNPAKDSGAARSGLAKSKGMPAEADQPVAAPDSVRDLDALGNPRRQAGGDGPDSRTTGEDSRPGNTQLFSMVSHEWMARLGAVGRWVNTWTGAGVLVGAGLGLGTLFHVITPVFFVMAPLYAALVVPSLILHEMGHAKMADRLGDPTARLQGRLGWGWRDILTHIQPFTTVALPLLTLAFTGLMFGGATPVPVNENNFNRPDKDMAKVALAGPAVNFALALAGAAVYAGLAAAGVGGVALALAGSAVLFNVMLGVFNLIPLAPLDGHHVLRHVIADWFKAPEAAAFLDKHAGIQLYGLVMAVVYGGAYIGAAIAGITGVLLLPGAMLAGMLMAGTPAAQPPTAGMATAVLPESKLLLVQLSGASRPLGSDIHLGLVDVTKPGGMKVFAAQQTVLNAELAAAGLGVDALAAYGASPVASYRRINTATIRVPLSSAEAFKDGMAARGYKVYENARRSIVRPIEDVPGAVRPAAETMWGAISMKDTLKLSTADKVHEIARGRWGKPGTEGLRSWLARGLLRLFGDAPAQPKVAVIDTGVDIEHPLVKPGLAGHKDIRPDGDGIDDNGHGTWVTSMVLNYAPWLKSITHYKAFANGGASTDDVLKGLTMAANDGNLIMSNSWGDDGGDPDGPDSQLVQKLGAEGHIMVFAAGNNGYAGANSIGSPAIAVYKDAKTGATRVIAVAATDANKGVVSFSSKGPGSAVTAKGGKWENYPRKPDAAEQGNNTEGAWPGGKTRAISGTSMSTPKFAGTLALLAMMFGVTEKGEKLDRIVVAVMSTLTNERGQGEAAIGSGFNAVKAAYDKLVAEGLSPAAPGWVSRLALRIMG